MAHPVARRVIDPKDQLQPLEKCCSTPALHGLIFNVSSNIFDFLLTQNVQEGRHRIAAVSHLGNDRGFMPSDSWGGRPEDHPG